MGLLKKRNDKYHVKNHIFFSIIVNIKSMQQKLQWQSWFILLRSYIIMSYNKLEIFVNYCC